MQNRKVKRLIEEDLVVDAFSTMSKKSKKDKAKVTHEKSASDVKIDNYGKGKESVRLSASEKVQEDMKAKDMESSVMEMDVDDLRNADQRRWHAEENRGEGEVGEREEYEEDSRALGEISGRREENKKNKTRADNLKKYKMIRSEKILRYEEDLSSQEKKCIQTVARYRSSHIGYKFVEAYLVPSARENNSEANKNKIVRYVNNQGYRVA